MERKRPLKSPDWFHRTAIIGFFVCLPFTFYYVKEIADIISVEWSVGKVFGAIVCFLASLVGMGAWLEGGIDNKG